MAKFRKKPVVIEAHQFVPGFYDSPGVPDEFKAACCRESDGDATFERPHVHTLEGLHWITAGDWIIRGVAGEFYPCKPDIFAATYEAVPIKGCATFDECGRPVPGSAVADAKISQALVAPLYDAARAILARPVGSVEALRAWGVRVASDAYMNGYRDGQDANAAPWGNVSIDGYDRCGAAIIARLLEPRSDAPEADKKGAGE